MRVCTTALLIGLLSTSAIALSQHADGHTPSATVCLEGCEFSDLNAAIRSTPPHGVISVAPGVYNSCGVVDKPLRLIGLKDAAGRRAHLAGGVCEGKGALVLRAPNILIEGFEISDVTVPDKNGACIRIDPQAGDITVRDCTAMTARMVFWADQNKAA